MKTRLANCVVAVFFWAAALALLSLLIVTNWLIASIVAVIIGLIGLFEWAVDNADFR